MNTIENNGYKIGEEVICNGKPDIIELFITPDDKENWEMGYRVQLRNEGTQTFESISKTNSHEHNK